MTTLLLFLPPRSRLQAHGRSAPYEPGGREYEYACTTDGQHISQHGRLPAEQLPHTELVIAIPAESDLAWRRVTLPKAGRQMRAALAGMLEETVLDEPESLHFAIEAETAGGDEAWVILTARAPLAQHLAELEAAHVFVDRVTPVSWPGRQPQGHFEESGLAGSPSLLRWSHPEGVTSVPLSGGLARQLFPPALVEVAQWTATPGSAAEAERWLGAPVNLLTREQRALGVIDSPWNLRQFELAQRARGLRALRNLYRAFMRRNWRPVRWGLTLLIGLELLGLNAHAWQQKQLLKDRKAALETTLRSSYPHVRAILDAPAQMRRETDTLRASAGRAGDQDLETLLAAAAQAWPATRGPADSLSFEPGRLQLSAKGWSPEQIQQFRAQLQSESWQLDSSEGRMTLSRAERRTAQP